MLPPSVTPGLPRSRVQFRVCSLEFLEDGEPLALKLGRSTPSSRLSRAGVALEACTRFFQRAIVVGMNPTGAITGPRESRPRKVIRQRYSCSGMLQQLTRGTVGVPALGAMPVRSNLGYKPPDPFHVYPIAVAKAA
jgi:hypothetical protein